MVQLVPLVNWGNGMVMIGVLALVVISLIVILVNFMNSGNKDSGN